jgi:hypothetical protein
MKNPERDFKEGLARLEALTIEFQRELGKLQQVANEAADGPTAADELAPVAEESRERRA